MFLCLMFISTVAYDISFCCCDSLVLYTLKVRAVVRKSCSQKCRIVHLAYKTVTFYTVVMRKQNTVHTL